MSNDRDVPPPDEAIALLWVRYYAELALLAGGLGEDGAGVVLAAFGALLRQPRLLRDPTAAHAWLVRAVLSSARTRRWRQPAPAGTSGIVAALGRLPARQRECVVLLSSADLSDADVAQLVRTSPASVRRLYQDGLRRLAAIPAETTRAGQPTTIAARLAELSVPAPSWEQVKPGLTRLRRRNRAGLVIVASACALAALVAVTVTIAQTRSGHLAVHRTRPRPELAIKGDLLPVTLSAEPGFLVYQSGQSLATASGITAGNAAEPARYNDIRLAAGRPGLSYSAPAVNQARTELAFVEAPAGQLRETDGEGDIAVSALNGSDLRVLTDTGLDSDPVWSPDGKRIAFLRQNRIWLMSANGSGQHLLGLYIGTDSIAWSPDGRYLAITSIAYPVNRIAIMNIAGVSYTWFTPITGPGQYQPAWSPDGKQLVYGESGQNALFVSDLNGSATRRLTTCSRPCQQDSEPAWSPDGTQIAFVRTIHGKRQVAVVSVHGGRVRFVTAGPQQHDEPSW